MFYIWHIAKNEESKVFGLQFHGNQDCVTIKAKSSIMLGKIATLKTLADFENKYCLWELI